MRKAILAGMLLATSAMPASAQAGNNLSQALSECLVLKSTGEDRLSFAGWMLAAMGQSPRLKDIATIAPGKKDEMDRAVARIFSRLVGTDCVEYARPLIKARDQQGFAAAFGALGRMAMQDLMGDTETQRAMGSFVQYLDMSALEEVSK